MSSQRVEIPDRIGELFDRPRGGYAYRCAYGGRGSGKSYNLALMAAIWGMAEPLRVLCVREFQASIKESFHAELRAAIGAHDWLASQYDVGVDYLRGHNGTEFIFRGLRHNASSLKSLAGIDLTVVEEAEDVPEHSWVALLPTVFRRPKSELWCIWNPMLDGSPTDKRFRKQPPDRCKTVRVNWQDNPWFPPSLDAQRRHDREVMDDATYSWIWDGEYRQNSNAQVLAGKYHIAEFGSGSDWDGPYYGIDWGFSQDPTAGVKCWVHDERLWIEYDAARVGLELDDTARYLIDHLPGIEEHTARADSARPESISYVQRNGMPYVRAVKKWPGSIEDGIAHLRSYREIVIHPRCKDTIHEARTYSYKIDRLTGDVMSKIVDANNHCIDALRYALSPLIRNSGYTIAL